MKSKIQKNQILKKGIAVLILLNMIFAMFSTTIVSFAETEVDEDKQEEQTDIIVGNDEDIVDSEILDHEEIKIELDEILNRLTELEANAVEQYKQFILMINTQKEIDISSELELRYLSAYVSEGNSCYGKTFNIRKNIELNSNIEWEPIGSKTRSFRGTINGNGYTISGMTITIKRSYAGLIGYLGQDGVAKNIIISNANINIEPEVEKLYNDLIKTTRVSYGYLGAIAGYAEGASIINCTNNANISGGNYVGGIVGYAENKVSGTTLVKTTLVKDCLNTGTIKGYALVGGIAGIIKGGNKKAGTKYSTDEAASIERCINKGTVYGIYVDVGGIVGLVKTYARVEDSVNYGSVSITDQKLTLIVYGKTPDKESVPQNVGGIAGTLVGEGYDNDKIDVETRLVGCINEESATVSGYKDVGGIVGQLGGDDGGHSVVYQCISYSDKVSGASAYDAYDYSKNKIKPIGIIAGNIGVEKGANYQGGRVYNSYYYVKNERLGSKKIQEYTNDDSQRYAAVGRINGSTNKVYGNLALRVSKDEKGNYLYQSRYYEDGNTKGYIPYYYSDGKWHYAKKGASANKWTAEEGIATAITGQQYPNYTGNAGFSPVKDSNGGTNRANYQPWLKRIIEHFMMSSNGKAVVDNKKPTVSKVVVKNSSGNSFALKGDKILIDVNFNENIYRSGTAALKFKIGDKEYNSTFTGIDKNVAKFSYTLTGKEEGEISAVSVTGNAFYDRFVNQTDVTISGINNKISEVLKNAEDVVMTVGKQNKENEENTWAVNYDISGGRYIDGKIYFNADDTISVKAVLDHKVTSGISNTEKPKLKVKIGNEIIELPYDKISEKTNATYLYYKGNVKANGKITEIYLETTNKVTLTNTKKETTYSNVTLVKDNTKATISGVTVDTQIPTPKSIGITSAGYYGVGDKITVAVTFSEGLNTEAIPELIVKFNGAAGKNNGGKVKAGNVKTENDETTVTYDYTISDGDNGELSISLLGEISDVAGNKTDLSKINYTLESIKYADTIVPTLNIIPSNITNGITNLNEITYTFDWSEEVSDFTIEDITINGGKVKSGTGLVQDTNDKTKYTLVVETEVAQGNDGEVQVIVEAGKCKDLVGLTNTRAESKVRVDKKGPTLVNYTVNKSEDGSQIIIKIFFDEAIGTANTSDIEVKFDGKADNGKVLSATIDENDKRIVTYVYNISGADQGNPTIKLKTNTVKDVIGNTNVVENTLPNDITLIKSIIIVSGKEYSFSKNGKGIVDFSKATYFKAGDILGVTVKVVGESTGNSYQYEIKEKCDLTHMKYMKIDEENEKVTFSSSNKTGNINVSEANIYFDTIYPIVKTEVFVEDKTQSGIYKENDKLIIKLTASEELAEEKEIPVIQVNFSNSGKGKYNYESADKTGLAKFTKEEKTEDNKTVLYYEYIIKDGDDGQVSISFVSGKITDLAGNESKLNEVYTPKAPSAEFSEKNELGINITDVKFYKNDSCTQEIKSIENTKQNGDIYVKVTLDTNLYTAINIPINKDNAPKLYFNNEIQLKATGVKEDGSVIIYKYDKNQLDYLTSIKYVTLVHDSNVNIYSGKDAIEAGNAISRGAINHDTADFEVDPRGLGNNTITDNVIADTVAPTVVITAANGNNPINNGITNADEITYTFDWSEEVKGFETSDITINGGIVKPETALMQDANDKTKYTLVVLTSTPKGSVGDIQVIVEQNACEDITGHKNIRTESVIKVDKQSPILIGLEARANSEIKLNADVDTVKEYYKADDEVTIVALFNETIESTANVPVLNLQFSESGNAKGTVTEGIKQGNKVTYTYKIVSGDLGELAVKGFSGSVVDAVGNETNVTKRVLDGDKIIADTRKPELKELKVVNPSEGTYKDGNTIVIEAIYDETIYSLIDNEVNYFVPENVPTLKLKFGNGEEREVTATGYASEEDKTKLIYKYTIVEGDNGELSITSYSNKENVKVTDIAGNEAKLGVKQTGNKVIADTKRPEVENITAKVENPTISNTEIYYKEGNIVKITLTFDEIVKSNVIMPEILIGFSEEESVEPAQYNTWAYESNWNVNSTKVEYSYRIQDGDNGYLWVKVPENQFADIAGNGNVEKAGTRISNIFADTTLPTVTVYRDTEAQQNNQTITIKATFNENIYDLDEETRIGLTEGNAPKLVYSFGNGLNKEVEASNINGAEITYTITKNAVEDNGELHYELAKGDLCDRAGNKFYTAILDTTAPILKSVEISSNAGKYDPYCKDEKEIYVIATFNEPIKAENIKIKAKVGETEIAELLDGEILEEANTKVKFTYTVKAGDMGEFKIVDICAEVDEKITEENADNTYGWVRDEHGNQNNIYSLEDENVEVEGEAHADTKNPYITAIKAIAGEKEIATYVKEEGKDAVITVGKTKENTVEYIVTYSEKVPYEHFDRISIINGNKKSIVYTNSSMNEYKITVQTTGEGVQSLIINGGTVEDKAGNADGFVRLDAVTVDFTKPTVRFISEYNGGVYVLPTNINKVEIRTNVEISEDIAKIEYKWDDGQYAEIENYSSSSDIAVPTKAFSTAGTHKLYIKVMDLAGNIEETSKTYQVVNANINMTLNTEDYTNQDITLTVKFDNELTDNRKVLFQAEGSTEVVQLEAKGTNQEGGIEYIIPTNGKVYVEATDRIGNKVFTERTITNIDKVAPEVELSINGANLVIGTGKEAATIKSGVEVIDENRVEIKYIYSNNETLTEEEKTAMQAVNNHGEAIKVDAVSGTYYLHVIAKDAAGNETVIKSNGFRVFETNVREKEVITKGEDGKDIVTKETIPAEIEMNQLIAFKQEGKFIQVTCNNFIEGKEYFDIIKEKNINLTDNKIDGYINYEYSYVEVNKPTTITVVGEDACGNTVKATYEVTRESIEGPEIYVYGNPEYWTNCDITLNVNAYEELSELTVNGESILSEDKFSGSKLITENGEYKFIATDIYGLTTEKVIKVTKIDKVAPVITKAETTGKNITITATDELSGVIQYAMTTTSEIPLEWSNSNVIKNTEDGAFYVWAMDEAGNITRSENVVIVDTAAPEISFNYSLLTVYAGMPIETTIITNEKSLISYSWDKETWINSEELLTSLKINKKYDMTGKYTLYAKATDEFGNTSDIKTIEFTVAKPAEVKDPQIIFEGLVTRQIDGVNYVKVSADMTTEDVKNKMKQEALYGLTPEYTKLAEENKLKTGSEIALNGETKYIVIVNGDVNCDGKVTPLDVTYANSIRLNKAKVNDIQKLAADFDFDGAVKPMDITMINSYRLGKIKGI